MTYDVSVSPDVHALATQAGRHQPASACWMWGTSSQGIAALLDLIQDFLIEQDLSCLGVHVENPHLTQRAGGFTVRAR